VLRWLKYRLFFSFFFLFFVAFSQEKNHELGIEYTTHFGSILPHRPLVNRVIQGHSWISELSLTKQTKGNKTWQQLFGYPKIGVSFVALDLGNPEELGNSFGIFPFVQFPLVNRKIKWNLKLGYGLGYIEKPFNIETNFKNVVIGSTFNALINLNSLWEVNLSKRLSSSLGISLVHFSNGSFKRPNLGINVFSLNLGVNYKFGKYSEYRTNEIPERIKSWKKIIVANAGLKEIAPVGGGKFPVYTTSLNLIRPFSKKSAYGIATDFFYNSSLEDRITRDTGNETDNNDNWRIGIAGIYSLDVGGVSFLIQTGVYLRTKSKREGYIYSRFTTRYYLNKHVFVNLGLKTHFAVADFIETGIGYQFKN